MKAVVLSVLPLAFVAAACGGPKPDSVASDTTDDPSCTVETRDSACHQETSFELRPFSAEALEQARATPIGGEIEDAITLCMRGRGGWWVIADPRLVDGAVHGTHVPHSAEGGGEISLPASEISALLMPVNRYVTGAGDPQIYNEHSCP